MKNKDKLVTELDTKTQIADTTIDTEQESLYQQQKQLLDKLYASAKRMNAMWDEGNEGVK
jgi:hypothetical protein